MMRSTLAMYSVDPIAAKWQKPDIQFASAGLSFFLLQNCCFCGSLIPQQFYATVNLYCQNNLTILDFTGVDSISMCLEDCTWLENIDIDLYPWDAGTDSGECCYWNRILIINLCLWSAKNWEKLFLINQNWPNSSWIVQTDKNMWCSCHLMIHTSKTLSNC